jgi:hypothetical protein
VSNRVQKQFTTHTKAKHLPHTSEWLIVGCQADPIVSRALCWLPSRSHCQLSLVLVAEPGVGCQGVGCRADPVVSRGWCWLLSLVSVAEPIDVSRAWCWFPSRSDPIDCRASPLSLGCQPSLVLVAELQSLSVVSSETSHLLWCHLLWRSVPAEQ